MARRRAEGIPHSRDHGGIATCDIPRPEDREPRRKADHRAETAQVPERCEGHVEIRSQARARSGCELHQAVHAGGGSGRDRLEGEARRAHRGRNRPCRADRPDSERDVTGQQPKLSRKGRRGDTHHMTSSRIHHHYFSELVLVVFLIMSRCDSQPVVWESMNGPYGGGVQSVIVNRQGHIFTGGSGVFRSTDDGAHWTHVSAFIIASTMAIDSSGIIFAGGY